MKSHIQATELTLSEPLHDILIIKKNGVDVIDEYSALTLTAEATPANGIATTDSILWESSDPEIATVNNGTLTLLKGGSVTITASIDGIEKSRDLEIIDFDVYREDQSEPITGRTLAFVGAGFSGNDYSLRIETGNTSVPANILSWATDWVFSNGKTSQGSSGIRVSISGSGYTATHNRQANGDTVTIETRIFDVTSEIAIISFTSTSS